MAEEVRAWGKARRFESFPEPGHESVTLTALVNDRDLDLVAIAAQMQKRGYTLHDGSGAVIGKTNKTMRVAHMGDCTLADLRAMLGHLDEVLRGLGHG